MSVTCLFGSVSASRSGMMQGMLVPVLPSAFGSSGKGCLRRNSTTLSEAADSSSVASISARPNASRAAKPLDAGHHVLRADRLAVMEAQPVAQRQPPELAVILDRVARDHLRLHRIVRRLPIQRVEHEVAVVAGDGGGGPDRVDHRRVAFGDEAQQLRGLGEARRGERAGRGRGEEGAALHRLRSSSARSRTCRSAWTGPPRLRCWPGRGGR